MEEITQPQQELTPIKITEIPSFIRKEWKKNLVAEKDVIADETLVGHSKIISDSKFPFCINLTTPEHFTIIYKLNLKSKLVNVADMQTNMACYLSRKTWKKDILAHQ